MMMGNIPHFRVKGSLSQIGIILNWLVGHRLLKIYNRIPFCVSELPVVLSAVVVSNFKSFYGSGDC